ncbi:MAG: uroporphyrinogen-III C-methyltransferase, partial [Chloroflexi bacterium]|nr:uroporphyrinogen-III C-methyltransferase [Chloroflexota bacterium]
PAVAGIPVTHRGVSRSFAVVTGHTHDGGLPDLPVADTLVVLMSVNPLKKIVVALLAQGWPATIAAAVIAEGTTPRQRVVTGTLADIADRANGLEPPAVLVVGEVVRLREALATPPSP